MEQEVFEVLMEYQVNLVSLVYLEIQDWLVHKEDLDKRVPLEALLLRVRRVLKDPEEKLVVKEIKDHQGELDPLEREENLDHQASQVSMVFLDQEVIQVSQEKLVIEERLVLKANEAQEENLVSEGHQVCQDKMACVVTQVKEDQMV